MITEPSSNNAPLVSVIVPIHNAADTIDECIESLINQSYRNLEIILCNDHSTDHSCKLIEQHLLDPRISWIQSDQFGACAARNTGFRHCRGDYVQFLDADDLMARNKLELQLRQLEACTRPDQTVSFSALIQFQDGSSPGSGERWHFQDATFDNPLQLLCKLLSTNKYIQTGQWLIPHRLAKMAGPWDETLIADQDGEYFSRVLQQAGTVVSSPAAITYYRRARSGQISSGQTARHFESRLQAFRAKLQRIESVTQPETVRKIVQHQCQTLAIASYPQAMTVSEQATRMLAAYQCKFNPSFPTLRLALIAKVFGWRIARWCSFIKHAGRG